ncbi:MAG: ParA family protein [Myxococcales bacterium]|nr:ParA family protein [Myxococcales bacterium]
MKRFKTGPDGPPRGDRSARVVAVAAQKGGVGKTTTAVNLACALAAHHGQRVLLVDMDPQAHVHASLRAVSRPGPVAVSDILLAEPARDLMDAVVPSALEGLSLTPPDKALHEAEGRLASKVGREVILQAALDTARTWFDTIVIDCPPNLGNLTLNALLAADEVLVPCDMSLLALEGVADLLDTVQTVNTRLRHPLDVAGVLRTRVDTRNVKQNEAIDGALRDNFGGLVLDTVIPVNSALAQAQTEGQPIERFQPRSRGAVAYRALAAELLAHRGERVAS